MVEIVGKGGRFALHGINDNAWGPITLLNDPTNGVSALRVMGLQTRPTNAITGIGTITISSTTIGGLNTKFLDPGQVLLGSTIYFGSTNLGVVVSTNSQTNITVNKASGVALAAGTGWTIQPPSYIGNGLTGGNSPFFAIDSAGNGRLHGQSVSIFQDFNGNDFGWLWSGSTYGIGSYTGGGLPFSVNATAAGNSLFVDGSSTTQVGFGINVANSLTVSSGLTTITAGLASTKLNGGAPNTISVGASPFTFTCPAQYNVEVTIGGGIVTALSVNGSSVASGLTLTGVSSFDLQTNETLTVTYSSTPTMKWKPL